MKCLLIDSKYYTYGKYYEKERKLQNLDGKR